MVLLFIGNRKTQSTIIVLIQKLANLLYILKKVYVSLRNAFCIHSRFKAE